MAECFLSDSAFDISRVLGERKEAAIAAAINVYFGDGLWTESQIKDTAASIHYSDGREIFTMNEKPMLEFGPVQSTTEVDRNTVKCLFYQEIKVLYGGL